jgi:sugar/nucleoside kinase (ribokinase family)
MEEPNASQIEPQLNPVEYLTIGHITADLTDSGVRLGGTVTFSGLTAAALGLRPGIITSHTSDLDRSSLADIWIKNIPAGENTTFKNISDGAHRKQYLYHKAKPIQRDDIPAFVPPPAILHLGPVANEVDPDILSLFPESLKCLTPQGWFRHTNADHEVTLRAWENAETYLAQADAAVISQEDVQYDEHVIANMASAIPVFVVTENYKGARVYWHNDARYFKAPEVKYQEDTGAGDIFATAFFYRYMKTKDPWEAGRFAVLLASWSVTRSGLASIPTTHEIKRASIEVLEH